MESPSNSINFYMKTNWEAVLCVEEMLHPYAPGWQSITITPQEKYEGFCVHIVTTGSLDDIAEKMHNSYGWLMSTSQKITQDG